MLIQFFSPTNSIFVCLKIKIFPVVGFEFGLFLTLNADYMSKRCALFILPPPPVKLILIPRVSKFQCGLVFDSAQSQWNPMLICCKKNLNKPKLWACESLVQALKIGYHIRGGLAQPVVKVTKIIIINAVILSIGLFICLCSKQ